MGRAKGTVTMSFGSPKSVEATIKRLTQEIARIDDFFYNSQKTEDRLLYAGMLERKRDDMVRSAVLQMHTSIEDILNILIICRVLGVSSDKRKAAVRTNSGRALRKMLFGAGSLGFDMKLNFAVALRLLNSGTRDRLMVLNSLRNKCSHNWLLKVPIRQGKRPRQKKPPLLLYDGRDLHKVDVLQEFSEEFGSIYFKLFIKYLG
jgi:hypothetical protein